MLSSTFQENFLQSLKMGNNEAKFRKIFDEFIDTDDDGIVSSDELANFFGPIFLYNWLTALSQIVSPDNNHGCVNS